jgi:hypothetical protein
MPATATATATGTSAGIAGTTAAAGTGESEIVTAGGLQGRVEQQEAERRRRTAISAITAASGATTDPKSGGTGSRIASTPLTSPRPVFLPSPFYSAAANRFFPPFARKTIMVLYRRFEIRNSLTRFRTDRDGLTVGNSSKIHCSRVRMRSLEAVEARMIQSQRGRARF